MKIQIRKNVFETNSSSVHSICISKEKISMENLPKHIIFRHGEFGWENKTYHDIDSKASYLYQAIYDSSLYQEKPYKEMLNPITKLLGKIGITCEFEPNNNWNEGYIDHSEKLNDFLNILQHEKRFYSYLFGDSYIITGNDNDYDGYDDYKEDNACINQSKYDVYEKGN